MLCTIYFYQFYAQSCKIYGNKRVGEKIVYMIRWKQFNSMWFYYKFWKVSWQSQKELIWPQIKINLINARFTIPENRILSIMESMQVTIKNLPYTTAWNLSKLCGKIISTKLVLGNIAQIKTRNIYKIIQAEL